METTITNAQIDEKPVVLIKGKLAVYNNNWTPKNIININDEPPREARVVAFYDLPSMLAYTKKEAHECACTPAFFIGDSSIDCIIDYASDDMNQWGDSKAWFKLVKSQEWNAWRVVFDTWLAQSTLAEHLEDYSSNIISPNGAEVLTMIQQFKANRTVTFGSVFTSAEGQTTLNYENKAKAGSIQLPEKLVLQLPVYEGAEELTTYQINVRLKVRLDEENRKVVFMLVPVRLDIPLRNALKDIAESIEYPDGNRDGIQTPNVYIGSVAATTRSIYSNL